MYNETTALALISDAVATATLPTFTANRKALAAAMAHICNTVDRKNTIPILDNVLIESDADGVRLVGTDLDAVTKIVIAATDSYVDFKATLPAHVFKDMVAKSKSETVKLTVVEGCLEHWVDDTDSEGKSIKRQEFTPGKVKVEFDGGASVTLESLPASDFPNLGSCEPDEAKRFSYSLQANDLAKTFAGVAYAISTEVNRYYLRGVYLNYVASGAHGIDGFCATTTNGHQLAHRSIPALVPTDIPGAIVPHKTVLNMIKLLGKKPEGKVFVSLHGSKITFSHGDTVMTSKLIDGTFPDYERCIPRYNSHLVTVDREALAAMVAQVMTVSREKNRAVALEIKHGKIVATVNTSDGAQSSASMAAMVPDDCDLIVGFNAKYILDICGAVSAKTIELHIQDAGAPMVIKAPDDTQGLSILMPMRV